MERTSSQNWLPVHQSSSVLPIRSIMAWKRGGLWRAKTSARELGLSFKVARLTSSFGRSDSQRNLIDIAIMILVLVYSLSLISLTFGSILVFGLFVQLLTSRFLITMGMHSAKITNSG